MLIIKHCIVNVMITLIIKDKDTINIDKRNITLTILNTLIYDTIMLFTTKDKFVILDYNP